MNELCRLIWCGLIGFFRSRTSLEAEILVLRHQLNVLRRKSPKRPTFGNIDRLIFAGVCVPITSSALISRKNRLTSAQHDRAAMFRTGRPGRANQVEEPDAQARV